jgi:hypothetical protein
MKTYEPDSFSPPYETKAPVFKLAARSNLSYKEMLSELERIGHAVDVDGYRTHGRVLHNIGFSLMNELLEIKNATHE